MTEWVAVLVALVGGGGLGALATALVTARKNKREDRDALIDQLQEERESSNAQLQEERRSFVAELAKEREAFAVERTELLGRLDKMWDDKAASREHVAALRDHIWQRKDPPPPDPPAGYIH